MHLGCWKTRRLSNSQIEFLGVNFFFLQTDIAERDVFIHMCKYLEASHYTYVFIPKYEALV